MNKLSYDREEYSNGGYYRRVVIIIERGDGNIYGSHISNNIDLDAKGQSIRGHGSLRFTKNF
jgi:hypothetical protein